MAIKIDSGPVSERHPCTAKISSSGALSEGKLASGYFAFMGAAEAAGPLSIR